LTVPSGIERREAISLCERWRGSFTTGATVSIGLAAYRAGEETIEETVRRADAALYDAKRQGRDRVVFADAVGQSKNNS